MKLLNKIRSLSRKAKLAVTAVVLASAVAVPLAVNAEFYPNRPTYDYSKYNGNNNCDDPNNIAAKNGRCGSMNGPVFNSFINTPSYGDERAFFDGRRSDAPSTTVQESITDVNKGSQEVILRTYVHNNANQNTNADGTGVAKNAKVRIFLPTGTESVLRARSYISADNATMVEDTVDMLGTEKFNVSYVPGSAKLLRGTSSYNLSDNIVTTGALIGDKKMDGNLPGCFDYAALVEIRVKINVTPTPDLQVTKQVRMAGTTTWNKEISTKPGDKVQWLIGTKNISNATLTEVQARDGLPAHLNVVPGSVKVVNGTTTSVIPDAPLFASGVLLNTYPSGGLKYVIFDTTVKDDFSGCSARIRNMAYAKSKETPTEKSDSAVINVTKDNCNPPVVNPVYTCDSLKLTKTGGLGIKLDAASTANNGATFKQYVYNFGDGQNQTTTASSVNHTYANYGTYTAKVTAEFTVNGQTVTATGPQCEVKVTFDKPEEPKPKYTCDSLKAEKLGGRKVKFTAKASASNGATIKQYIFNYGDATTQTTTADNVEYTYVKDGKYTVTLTVEFTVNGQTVASTGPNCKVEVEFETPEEPKKPEYTCDALTIKKTGGRSIEVTVNASAKNGATIKRYIYTFGDGGEQTTDKNVIAHTYAKDGKYVVRAKVQFAVGNETKEVESDKCAAPVEFTSAPTPEQPVTPGKLPDTGAGSVAAIFVAVASVSTLGYYAIARRS